MKTGLQTLWVLITLTGLAAAATTDGPLSLNGYLQSVREQNQGYQAAKSGEEAAQLYKHESRLIFAPTLFSKAQYADDAKPSQMPLFNYDKIIIQNYELGIQQQTPIGLQGKLYYSLTKTEYRGLPQPPPPYGPFSDARPTLELSQPLWRNDFGTEVRALADAQTAGAEATEHAQAFEKQMQLVQAESAYWRLALARQNIELAKENLSRAERIFGWAKRRVKLSLSDRSDFLQATTVLQARKLELKTWQDEIRAASHAFNNSRGVSSDQVTEKLDPLSKELIAGLKIPERAQDRQDTLAAEKQSEALRAQALANREKNQPTLEVYGTYAVNQRSREDNQDAINESWTGGRPTKAIGLRFTSPLYLGDLSDTQVGYAKQMKAAELTLSRKKFLQEQDWRDLALRFNEAKERLGFAEELEKAQKEKFDHERDRHEKGRSTLFQVLTFESEYLAAQGMRLKSLNELLQIAAQMKLYGVN